MIKVKICGLRIKSDINIVNELKPDFVGFVFAKSKRQVSKEEVISLTKNLDKSIKTVGVFVNENIENILNIANSCKLDYIQLHGDETKQYIENIKKLSSVKIIKAFRIKDSESIKEIYNFEETDLKTDYYLVDAFQEGVYGGTGKTINLNLIEPLINNKKIILAGGLTSTNVESYIYKTKPFAVDISGGVETNGYKDYDKIKEFIKTIRMCKYE